MKANALPSKLRHAKRVRYARLGQQIFMRRLTERVVKKRVAHLLSRTASRMNYLARAFHHAREAMESLIEATYIGAA